jgi:hypothetical protein
MVLEGVAASPVLTTNAKRELACAAVANPSTDTTTTARRNNPMDDLQDIARSPVRVDVQPQFRLARLGSPRYAGA